MSKADDHYTRVAEQLIEKLKMGTASWQKPWNAGRYGARPMNPMTGKLYRGRKCDPAHGAGPGRSEMDDVPSGSIHWSPGKER